MANILAVCEQKSGQVRKVSREIVAAARLLADALGGTVDALVIGAPGLDAAAGDLGAAGADRVLAATDGALALYQPDGYAASVTAQAKAGGYAAVVLAATAAGRDLAPRLAVQLDAPLAMDVTGLTVEGGKVVATRPVYAGKAIQTLTLDAQPAVVVIRPNTFSGSGAPGHGGTVETIPAQAGAGRTLVQEVKAAEQGMLDVAEAPVVVSGGRGMKGPEHFALIEELAKAFGNAAVGASRAVVDAGWRPHGEQVGQTGKTVSPQLYVAVGISGAIQHLAGMRTAKVIVAINKDKDAPIFKVADYGIVGDAFEIVPKLTEEVRRLRAG